MVGTSRILRMNMMMIPGAVELPILDFDKRPRFVPLPIQC